jgi:hypothetical protein
VSLDFSVSSAAGDHPADFTSLFPFGAHALPRFLDLVVGKVWHMKRVKTTKPKENKVLSILDLSTTFNPGKEAINYALRQLRTQANHFGTILRVVR